MCARLEPVFLMSVVMHLDTLGTARTLCFVSRACADAVARMKQNPNYGMYALGTALAHARLANVLAELELFRAVETLAIDPHSLQRLPMSVLDTPRLVRLEGFLQQQHGAQQLDAVADRICALAVDAGTAYFPPLTADSCLRDLTIRVPGTTSPAHLKAIVKAARAARFLRRVVFRCDSDTLALVDPLSARLATVATVAVVIEHVNAAHVEDVLAFIQATPAQVAVTLLDLRCLTDLWHAPVVLLPFSHQNIQLPLNAAIDPRFPEVLRRYFPGCLELRGDPTALPITPAQTLVDLSSCTALEELFLNEAAFTLPVVVVLPPSLRRLMINKTESIAALVGLNETRVDPPTKLLFASLVVEPK